MAINNVEWVGDFTNKDKLEINRLREGQMYAIKSADAKSYENLCTKDIALMLTGFGIVRGRKGFYNLEKRFLERVKVKLIEQSPVLIKKSGNLAIEIGQQKFETFPDSFSPEGFKAIRKYMHVLEKTEEGWKFSFLMSNDN